MRPGPETHTDCFTPPGPAQTPRHDHFLFTPLTPCADPNPDDVWRSADGVGWELVTDDVPWNDRANHLVTVFDGS